MEIYWKWLFVELNGVKFGIRGYFGGHLVHLSQDRLQLETTILGTKRNEIWGGEY